MIDYIMLCNWFRLRIINAVQYNHPKETISQLIMNYLMIEPGIRNVFFKYIDDDGKKTYLEELKQFKLFLINEN